MRTNQRKAIRRLMVEGIVVVAGLGLWPTMPAVAYEPVAPWQLAQGSVYSSSAGRFEIAFPTPPEVTTEDDDIEGDPVEIHLFESFTTTSQYMVAYADLPPAFLSQGATSVLDQLRDSTFDDIDIDALMASEVDVQLSNYPGRRYRYSDNDGAIDMRLYLANERAYVLVAVDSNETDVDRFISSFVLR
ncbi:hypothetical protein IQ260_00885 [Leptolyngbya cf. ectocarpi LEGE 11479]|uniref:Uncharacterized protein n=1 Tax=Leptolyngbya cf. ectocarpi LEGE 11479 TaxID=1828722 RepID=A0A928X0L6_LEPEC|nr:hypothetical protein [Leptolyngbya ectocarpi]MBE9065206.1 hypothetical protein [Leptolyngbya cf. ectocarpi LEGE 11479]